MVEAWNTRFRAILDNIALVHPPRDPIDFDDVADMLSCVIDGSIIMSKALDDPTRIERQVMAFRSFIKLLFSSTAHVTAPMRNPSGVSEAVN